MTGMMGLFNFLGLALLPFIAMIGAVLVAASVQRWHRREPVRWSPSRPRPRFLMVVPAHNEASTIGSVVLHLKTHDYPQSLFEVVVIADNCDDDTADRAREAGATVITRMDPAHRGKGHALEFAIGQLLAMDRTWDALVIVDADSRLSPGFLHAVAPGVDVEAGIAWQQAYYTVWKPEESWRTKLMVIALALHNGVWLRGTGALGLGVLLRGNGMVLTRRGLERVPFRSYGLAEDLELGWDLRLRGEIAAYVPDACVMAVMPPSDHQGARSQRLRWEQGRRDVRRHYSPLIVHARCVSPWKKVLYLVELWMPPLSRLVILTLALGLLSGLTQAMVGLLISGLGCLVISVFVASAFVIEQVPGHYLKALQHAPRYILWKGRLLGVAPPREWIRTERHPSPK